MNSFPAPRDVPGQRSSTGPATGSLTLDLPAVTLDVRTSSVDLRSTGESTLPSLLSSHMGHLRQRGADHEMIAQFEAELARLLGEH